MRALKVSSIVLLSLVLIPVFASAQITPVGASAESTFGSYNVLNLINDSGLTGGVHDNNWENMWMAGEDELTPWIIFDLGDVYDLTATDVWQYLYSSDRAVDGFNILISDDGVTFTPAGSGNLTAGVNTAQTVAFTATGRYVRFDVTSNHGSMNYVGLSEVKFQGTIVPVELQSFSVE